MIERHLLKMDKIALFSQDWMTSESVKFYLTHAHIYIRNYGKAVESKKHISNTSALNAHLVLIQLNVNMAFKYVQRLNELFCS